MIPRRADLKSFSINSLVVQKDSGELETYSVYEMKVLSVLAAFIAAVVLIIVFSVKDRSALEAKSIGLAKLSLNEILLRKDKLDGQVIETIGFIPEYSSDLMYLFTDEKRAEIYDFESSIALLGDNQSIHSHIQSSCYNLWVTVKGKIFKNTSAFYNEDFILRVNEISGRVLKEGQVDCSFK